MLMTGLLIKLILNQEMTFFLDFSLTLPFLIIFPSFSEIWLSQEFATYCKDISYLAWFNSMVFKSRPNKTNAFLLLYEIISLTATNLVIEIIPKALKAQLNVEVEDVWEFKLEQFYFIIVRKKLIKGRWLPPTLWAIALLISEMEYISCPVAYSIIDIT